MQFRMDAEKDPVPGLDTAGTWRNHNLTVYSGFGVILYAYAMI